MTELHEAEDEWAEFTAFEVNVLAPERTLFEKLAAVHDAATRHDVSALSRHGRHFYDIHCLLNSDQVEEALGTMSAAAKASLIADIDAHSQAAEFSWSPRPEMGYAKSAAFDATHPMRSTITASFEIAQSLIHGPAVSLAQVDALVKEKSSWL